MIDPRDPAADPGLEIQGTLRLAGMRELPAGSRLTIHAHGEQSRHQYAKVAADASFHIERQIPATTCCGAAPPQRLHPARELLHQREPPAIWLGLDGMRHARRLR